MALPELGLGLQTPLPGLGLVAKHVKGAEEPPDCTELLASHGGTALSLP